MSQLQDRILRFRTMVHDDPESELGYFRLGQLLMEAGEHDEAATSFRRTLELSPQFSKVYHLLASSLLVLNRRDEAVRILWEGFAVADERDDNIPRDEMTKMLGQLGEATPVSKKPAANGPQPIAEKNTPAEAKRISNKTMRTTESITLSRACEAIEIPHGNKVMLAAGTRVRVTQALGGSFTVATENGNLMRIAAKDADAIGVETSTPEQSAASPLADASEVEKMVWAQLETVYDPEIPVNVVDLGLVYECRVIPLPEEGYDVTIKLTLTAPGCGMGDVLRADAQTKILGVPNVKDVHIEIVVAPPWNQSMMSEAAKLQLGL